MTSLRPALPADLEALAAIHVATWQEAYRGLIPAPFLARVDLEHGRSRLRRPLEADPPQVLVLEEGAQALGFVRFGPVKAGPREAAEVFAINVHPERWREGHGRRLLEAAQARLAEGGFRSVWLWVLESNQRAREFYAALGWEPDGERRVEGQSDGADLAELRYAIAL